MDRNFSFFFSTILGLPCVAVSPISWRSYWHFREINMLWSLCTFNFLNPIYIRISFGFWKWKRKKGSIINLLFFYESDTLCDIFSFRSCILDQLTVFSVVPSRRQQKWKKNAAYDHITLPHTQITAPFCCGHSLVHRIDFIFFQLKTENDVNSKKNLRSFATLPTSVRWLHAARKRQS